MPIFEYRCPAGHVTEQLDLANARLDHLVCACGLESDRVPFSVGAWQFGEGKKGSAVGEAIKRVKAKGL